MTEQPCGHVHDGPCRESECGHHEYTHRPEAALSRGRTPPEPDWALAEGTLRERLEYARDQHARAAQWLDAGLTFTAKPAGWHRACAEWSDQMVRDLADIEARLSRALDKDSGR